MKTDLGQYRAKFQIPVMDCTVSEATELILLQYLLLLSLITLAWLGFEGSLLL